MGSDNSKAPSPKKLMQDYENVIKMARLDHLKVDSRMIVWKSYLKTKLASPKYSSTPNWEIFKKPLENWVENETHNINLSWLGNAQFFAMHSSSKSIISKRNDRSFVLNLDSPASHREGRLSDEAVTIKQGQFPSVISDSPDAEYTNADLHSNKTSQESFPSMNFSPGQNEGEGSNPELQDFDSNITKEGGENNTPPVKRESQGFTPRSRIGSGQLQISAAEELKKFLRKELALKDHPVNEIIRIFKSTYENFFCKEKVSENKATPSKEEFQKMVDETLLPVKKILKLLRGFINLVYRKVIEAYVDELNDEDENPVIIIDYLLFQIMFDNSSSLLYQKIMACLQEMVQEDIRYFSEVTAKAKGKFLHELDSQMKEKFMLLNSQVPYDTVMKTLHLLKKIPNPYMKKDYITTMEQEMVESILNDLIKKGRGEEEVHLETDDKFTIYTYCLLRSGYTNIVVDIMFIEEFTHPDESNQAYVRFRGCLRDYILSGDYESYMALEEQNRLKSSENKTTLKCCASH